MCKKEINAKYKYICECTKQLYKIFVFLLLFVLKQNKALYWCIMSLKCLSFPL